MEKVYEYERAYQIIRQFYPEEILTEAELEEQFEQAQIYLRSTVQVPLERHQREALLSLLTDVMAGHAEARGTSFASEMVSQLNAGRYQLVAGSFFKFVYHDGLVVPLLWDKRGREQTLFRKNILSHL